jgi:hypothetical protein
VVLVPIHPLALLDKIITGLSESCAFGSPTSAISFSKLIRKPESTSLILPGRTGSEFAAAGWCAGVAVEKQDRVVEVTRGERNGMRYELRKTQMDRRSFSQMFARAAVPLRYAARKKQTRYDCCFGLPEYHEGFWRLTVRALEGRPWREGDNNGDLTRWQRGMDI